MGLLDTARRYGVARGVLGGSRPWLVVGGLAWGLRALQWAWRPSPTRVQLGDLRPGETIVITDLGPRPTRRQRRKQRRAERRGG